MHLDYYSYNHNLPPILAAIKQIADFGFVINVCIVE